MRNLRTWALGALAIVGLGAAFSAAQTIRNPLRYIPPPSTFYVATTGSNGNKCTQAAPCLTIQHVVDYVLKQHDFQGTDITISVAAGTFSGDQITIVGNNPGDAGANFGGWLHIIGAGKANTIVENSTCASGNNVVNAAFAARVRVGSMTLQTNCASGSNLSAFSHSVVAIADANVKLGTAPWAKVILSQGSAFNSSQPFEISGSALFGFSALNNSTVLYGPTTVTLTGTPNFTIGFADAINASVFADGGSTYVGSATGPTYSINTGSVIDREANSAALPGNVLGVLGFASSYYPPLLSCVGGAVGCSIVDVPTGLGTDGTATLATNSGSHRGSIILNTGSAATDIAGTVYIGLPAALLSGFCAISPGIGATNWGVGAVMQGKYDTTAGNAFVLAQWYNGGVALDFNTTYQINYVCAPAG